MDNITTENNMPSNFYVSSFKCGKCGKILYKTAFKKGEEFEFYEKVSKEEVRTVQIDSIFTCFDCLFFLAPRLGEKLTDGVPMLNVINNREEYEYILAEINKCSTKEWLK